MGTYLNSITPYTLYKSMHSGLHQRLPGTESIQEEYWQLVFLWYEKGTGVYLCFQSFSATVGVNRTGD